MATYLYFYRHIFIKGDRNESNTLLTVYYISLVKVAVDYSQDNCISGTDLSAVRLYRCIVKAEGSRAS